MSELKERKPLSRKEVIEYLNEKVDKERRQWGEDYIYTRWAKEAMYKNLMLYDNGVIIPVCTVEYVSSYGNGCGDYSDTLYSDGTVKTCCYGYLD